MTVRLRGLVTDYLRVRRSLGYKLEYTERLLFGFVDYLSAVGAPAATVEHAVGFAMAPPGASPRWQALRLSAVRCFARWAHLQDPTIQVPSPRRVRHTQRVSLFSTHESVLLLNLGSGLTQTI